MMIRNAEIELGYCRMDAPIDGRISRINLHVGNLVGDGQSSLLATIVKIDPIHAYANISESDLLRYRGLVGPTGGPGASVAAMPMELGLADERGYPHRGQADYQEPAADPGTGTIRVRGTFPNPDGAILPGFFVRVRIPAGRRDDVLLVPERALGTDQAGQFLLVVGGTTSSSIGRSRRGAVRRIASGRGEDRARRPRRRRGAPPGPAQVEGHPGPRGEAGRGRRRRGAALAPEFNTVE